jgi:hypothetical protein
MLTISYFSDLLCTYGPLCTFRRSDFVHTYVRRGCRSSSSRHWRWDLLVSPLAMLLLLLLLRLLRPSGWWTKEWCCPHHGTKQSIHLMEDVCGIMGCWFTMLRWACRSARSLAKNGPRRRKVRWRLHRIATIRLFSGALNLFRCLAWAVAKFSFEHLAAEAATFFVRLAPLLDRCGYIAPSYVYALFAGSHTTADFVLRAATTHPFSFLVRARTRRKSLRPGSSHNTM